MVINDAHILTPGPQGYVRLHGKWEMEAAGRIKDTHQMTLELGDYPG
jgi:hypothetical protein